MKKKTVLIFLLTIVTITMTAQDKLIRVDSESLAWQKDNPQYLFADKEKARLLMPQGAAFGMECIPSFSPEWTLTYDSVAHVLVYKIAEKSIWYTTYRSMHKLKKVSKNHSKSVPRKHPKNYEAPDVKTYSLSVTPEQVQKLRAIWRTAVGAAEDREIFMLDGTKWEFFIDGRRAKSHREKNVLVKFTNELAEAVETGNVSRKDSLFEAYVREHPEVMQTRRYVESYVLDKEGKPLPNAWVFVDGQSMMGATSVAKSCTPSSRRYTANSALSSYRRQGSKSFSLE